MPRKKDENKTLYVRYDAHIHVTYVYMINNVCIKVGISYIRKKLYFHNRFVMYETMPQSLTPGLRRYIWINMLLPKPIESTC